MSDLITALSVLALQALSLFNKKARLLLQGQKKTFRMLREQRNPEDVYIWFHAASLGDFEQGRPLIEKIKKEQPGYKILLTFFSPTTYEAHQNYAAADLIGYLPFDQNRNVLKFLDLVQPTIAVFINKPLGVNFSEELHYRKIPAFIVSAIFNAKQAYFNWYGFEWRYVLDNYTHIFVQDEPSRLLLEQNGFHALSVSGDTRFDRVYEIYEQRKHLPLIDQFLHSGENEKAMAIVAGNTWPKDEDLLFTYFNQTPNIKLIIVPHEMTAERFAEIRVQSERPTLLYSQTLKSNIQSADCLIIDCFGLLSSLYRYGDLAFVGGGFNAGVHNILEASVFGIPVLFGPNYRQSKEAIDMMTTGGGISVTDIDEMKRAMNALLSYPKYKSDISEKAKRFVVEHLGATERVYSHLQALNVFSPTPKGE
ncbi:3-deoxy-D-manno-octulosonic acid transferase [Bacteroidia bacterium]|nr:3-deoxy-D-manno-octulosonic acid transferase [Bacteroidia bacterium]